MKIGELISQKCPGVFEGWDKYDHELFCPESIRDDAKIRLNLICENGDYIIKVIKITDLQL